MEVDHIDPDSKVSHTVWSWTPKRRELELSKCQVLCRKCHRRKTSMRNEASCGVIRLKLRKMSDNDVLKAVLLRRMGQTVREIGIKFNVSHTTVAALTRAAMDGKEFRRRGYMFGT